MAMPLRKKLGLRRSTVWAPGKPMNKPGRGTARKLCDTSLSIGFFKVLGTFRGKRSLGVCGCGYNIGTINFGECELNCKHSLAKHLL